MTQPRAPEGPGLRAAAETGAPASPAWSPGREPSPADTALPGVWPPQPPGSKHLLLSTSPVCGASSRSLRKHLGSTQQARAGLTGVA